MDKYTVLIILFFTAILCLAIGNYSAQISIGTVVNTRGNLKTVGVQAYSSSNRTILESIDWGKIGVGETKNVTAYIHNTGNTNATITVTTTNYQPATLINYSSFHCPLNNTILRSDQIVETVFTLHIHHNVTGVTDFTFIIIVTGTA